MTPLKNFKQLSKDWNLSNGFRHAMISGFNRDMNYITTSTFTDADRKFCDDNGYRYEITNNGARIEL